ncbi:hypothetical protein KA005_64185 [bacterium]|nr:hypothetical protein [bacterium]
MAERFITTIGFKELQTAIKRNPQVVANESKKFFVRALSKYRKGIQSRPWQVGSGGGGSPVATRNLVDTHVTKIGKFRATIGPHPQLAKYAKYVHEGTRKMEARPWLDYVKEQNEGRVESLYKELLKNITADLAK